MFFSSMGTLVSGKTRIGFGFRERVVHAYGSNLGFADETVPLAACNSGDRACCER